MPISAEAAEKINAYIKATDTNRLSTEIKKAGIGKPKTPASIRRIRDIFRKNTYPGDIMQISKDSKGSTEFTSYESAPVFR